ncbi:uncharacterized protein LOC117168459 [Belonocnema kinseyi]|uniref:uncharacterized protein LOC117168459 n=1 Tax=Belonocnema kinseyi TaxID=2817044 RepID=UPI00143D5A23|nr:uncharacterized protein LOC117168459 [Belonocnema kinseyi]
MERSIEKAMDKVINTEGVTGVILTDHSGLCLGVKGNATTDSAGIVAAIADQVEKLEETENAPIISLQGDNRQCAIQRKGPVVGAIYKTVSS